MCFKNYDVILSDQNAAHALLSSQASYEMKVLIYRGHPFVRDSTGMRKHTALAGLEAAGDCD